MKKIKLLFAALLAVVAVQLVLLFGAIWSELKAAGEVAQADATRYASYLLADELRQSSDDLTRLARTYVVTGDPRWERQYFDVLDIRNGKKPRPQAYQRIYWDFLAASPNKPRPDDRTVPLETLMREAGFTDQEFSKLALAQKNSDGLVYTETVAMNMVKGLYEDANGHFTVQGEPNLAKARELMHDAAYHTYKAAIMGPLDEFFVLLDQRTASKLKETSERRDFYQNAVAAMAGVLVVSLLLALALAYRQMRGRMVAQQEAEAGHRRASHENERLNNSVIALLQTVFQLGQRDLTARANVSDDVIGTVASSINQMTQETGQTLSEVREIAGMVHQVSEQVREQTALVDGTVTSGRESLGRMTHSLDQAVNGLLQVSQLSAQSNQAAEQASTATHQALAAVDGTVKGIDDLRESISEMEKRFKRLGERSQEISAAVGLINSISERTHVLALNASMQAATAGEAGRGFAVVAEEVQRLSDSSRQATTQISMLVSNIQAETNETLFTVNRLISDVVRQSELAKRAGSQMTQTRETTALLVGMVQQIANFSQEQTHLSAQLQKSVLELNEGTEYTSEAVARQSEHTETLARVARRLTESVNQFKLAAAQ